ncbi:SDR family NAD(P)-dependent oxidoreductase [Rhizobium leguminosarum]|uniref:oxidoreductase n=5 Tax=Rhizobium TaxID=379 RepID=UPI001031953D|nr:oxidoreductase [Rhizobium leguminosarum]TBF87476.1 SDR family NAD(P)-dependent oxidoreductase [Rhizobium leguminosarum]TBG07823.1 SDR family NAD(P)-dependent oxidoreductase [Rhizobium leguminosarum]TBG50122.1 SDR family NAD(P)-dependent oxidoreductase [Rhizobium leguminosarum]TBG93529.1 SDR family NAD(P)-dependent oxidoreductase [Rhizobium leguminosarum]
MRVWFITGASRGFGVLMTKEALAAGDAVVATARNPEAVVSAVGDHPNLLSVALDVTDEAQARQAAGAAVDRFGRIDILVNNAGYGLLGAVEEAGAEEIERMYATNVFGLLKVTRAVLPQMRKQRSGHVLNISSIGGYTGYPGWGVYCSTKFAVEGLSESLAIELEPFGINVTVVEPGFFRTDFLADNSLAISPATIPDYVGTPAGNMRDFAAAANHAQPGNPAKFAAGMLALVNSAKPPLRMPFGSDTVAVLETKNAHVAKELDEWRTLALSTDFEKETVSPH